jgi:hypothetical protein
MMSRPNLETLVESLRAVSKRQKQMGCMEPTPVNITEEPSFAPDFSITGLDFPNNNRCL